MTDYIPGNQAYGPHKDQMLSSQPFKLYIDPEETTIAEAFLQNGYILHIRSANYKLVEFFEDGHVELYDLKEDVSEQNNLSEAMPWLVNELKEKLHRWQKEVNALMPVKNPCYEQ